MKFWIAQRKARLASRNPHCYLLGDEVTAVMKTLVRQPVPGRIVIERVGVSTNLTQELVQDGIRKRIEIEAAGALERGTATGTTLQGVTFAIVGGRHYGVVDVTFNTVNQTVSIQPYDALFTEFWLFRQLWSLLAKCEVPGWTLSFKQCKRFRIQALGDSTVADRQSLKDTCGATAILMVDAIVQLPVGARLEALQSNC